MSRKAVSGILLTLLLIGTLKSAFNIQPVEASGTIYIRADGSIYPPTAPIQRDGNIYTFTDDIYDSIWVERSNVIINGASYMLRGEGWGHGILLEGRSNVTIMDIEIRDFNFGVFFDSSSNNTVWGNNITMVNEYGIYFQRSSGNFLYGNNITNSGAGIRLHRSSNNTLRSNMMVNNTYSFGVFGTNLSHFVNDIDVSNTVDGKPIYYWINKQDMVVPLNAGYVGLVNSTNITVKNLILSNNMEGVLLAYTTDSTITQTNITTNDNGIMLCHSMNNSILANTFSNDGLFVYDSSNNVVEDNLVNGRPLAYLENVSDYAVDNAGQVILVNCNNILVENLNLSHTSVGVELWGTNNTHIVNNNITANNGDGISIYCSSNNNIANNNISSNPHGIYLGNSTDNSIANNVITANIWHGIGVSYSSNNNISNNNITANEYEGIMLYDSSNNSITNNAITENNNGYGIYLWNSSKDDISENDITNNWSGIILYSSSNIAVTNNVIAANNWTGIYVKNSSLNLIADNDITNNEDGVELSDSINNTVTGNNVANNKNGVACFYSSNNRFYYNNLVNNTNQVTSLSSSINSWDDGYPSGGNYWSDHICSGNPSDGSQPYIIDANNIDHYPFQDPNGWLLQPPTSVDVYTQKEPYSGKGSNMPSDAFAPQEEVTLYAYVSYHDDPVANKLVAFQVNDPTGETQLYRTNSTDENGITTITFRIPSTPLFGEWTAYATATIAEQTVNDTLTFNVGWVIELMSVISVDEMGTPRDTFKKGECVGVEITLKNIAMGDRSALIALVVYDNGGIPIAHYAVSMTIQPDTQPIQLYCYLLIPTWALVGSNGMVYANAHTKWPHDGGTPYCPEVSHPIEITKA